MPPIGVSFSSALSLGGFGGHFGIRFLGFSGLWRVLGPSWTQLGSQRRILEPISEANTAEGCVWGVPGGRILVLKVAQCVMHGM